MIHQYAFEKLSVWKDSKDLVKLIYEVTGNFPIDERFGLISQIRRAAISVSSNLAEGTSRTTNAEQARFTTISYSSLMEVLNQAIISYELNYMNLEKYENIRLQIEKVANKLNGLKSSQLNAKSKPNK